jgi:pimeloyl-ACP methyl ester carboxylesterase
MVSIHYRDEGCRDRPVLVMIHGVMASLHTWDGWVAEMGRHFRIVRLDVPGFGLTGPGRDREYSGERMVRVLGLFLDRLGLGKVSIAGNSLGGYIAWNFALAQPDRGGAADPRRSGRLPHAQGAADDRQRRVARRRPADAGVDAARAAGPRDQGGLWQSAAYQPGVVDRYYDISRRPGNRRSMIDIFRVLVRVNREELHATPTRVAGLRCRRC